MHIVNANAVSLFWCDTMLETIPVKVITTMGGEARILIKIPQKDFSRLVRHDFNSGVNIMSIKKDVTPEDEKIAGRIIPGTLLVQQRVEVEGFTVSFYLPTSAVVNWVHSNKITVEPVDDFMAQQLQEYNRLMKG